MMRVVAAAIAVLAGSFAAEAASPPVVHPATVTPIGAHTCAGFYPEATREAHIGGVASLTFRITPTGAVSDVALAQSSGNGDLDDAAKSCVRTWRYVPVLQDGKPVDAAWTAEVEFKVVAAATAPVAPPSAAVSVPPAVLVEQNREACLHYPWWAARHHAEGNAVLKYAVGPDGTVRDIVVKKASGDKDLDEAAMTCVTSFKYRPLAPGAAPRPVIAQVTFSYLEHAPSLVRWVFVGATLAEIEATRAVKGGVDACLKQAAGRPEFASGLGGTTILRVLYERGAIGGVSVLTTSGNDALDHHAIDCYRAEPADSGRADVLRHVGSSTLKVVWRQFVPS